MKTNLHRYCFDTSKPSAAAAYAALVKKLQSTPGRGNRAHYIVEKCPPSEPAEEEIELETEHLFSNQWNSATDRVFDWFEAYFPNTQHKIKVGHYLDITDEMRAIRANTLKSAWSGKQFPLSSGMVFDTTRETLEGEYLKEVDLPLLRLYPIDAVAAARIDLTPEEKAYLLPLWREARGLGDSERSKARLVKLSKRFHDDYRETCDEALIQRDGLLWALSHGIDTENAIYYTHTKRWCFGWRNPLTEAEESAILDVISEFPFAYDLKCSDPKRNKGSV